MKLAGRPKTETDKNNNCENINKISIIFEDMNKIWMSKAIKQQHQSL